MALTFDDGPSRYSRRVVRDFQRAGARATFFLIGTQAKKYPHVAKVEVDAGMEIGNHTWDHKDLARLPLPDVKAEIDKDNRLLRQQTGIRPTFVRPPGGALSRAEKHAIGQPLAYWSVDTRDWRTRNTADTIKSASTAKPGQIVDMHDTRKTTVDAVPAIIKKLQAKGYHLVTMSELIGPHPKNGIGYGWGHHPTKQPSPTSTHG